MISGSPLPQLLAKSKDDNVAGSAFKTVRLRPTELRMTIDCVHVTQSPHTTR